MATAYSLTIILEITGTEELVDCELSTTMPVTAPFEPLMPTASSAVNAAQRPVPRWLKANCYSGTAFSVPVPSAGSVDASEAAAGASGTSGVGVSEVPEA